jgi:hypothetical protein
MGFEPLTDTKQHYNSFYYWYHCIAYSDGLQQYRSEMMRHDMISAHTAVVLQLLHAGVVVTASAHKQYYQQKQQQWQQQQWQQQQWQQQQWQQQQYYQLQLQPSSSNNGSGSSHSSAAMPKQS